MALLSRRSIGLACEMLAQLYSHSRLNILFLRHDLEERFAAQGITPTKLERASRVLAGANNPERLTGVLSMLGEVVLNSTPDTSPYRAQLIESLENDGFTLIGNGFTPEGEEGIPKPSPGVSPARGEVVVLRDEVTPGTKPLSRRSSENSYVSQTTEPDERAYAVANLTEILHSFPDVVKNLRKRTHSGQPLLINDEYDMQYLLGALLRIHFDDVRAEDPVPISAGRASRVDFLLHPEQIILELKYVRDDMNEAMLGDALLKDIGRYGDHPRCKHLSIFIYDPERRLTNAKGLIDDLERKPSAMSVKVIVLPS